MPIGDEAEALFERCCQRAGFRTHRLRPSPKPGIRRPDFLVRANGALLVAEVTEIQPNEAERKIIERLRLGGMHSWDGPYWPGERVRSEVKSKYGQLKAGSRGRRPTLLVVRNSYVIQSSVEPTDVWACFFGHIGVATEMIYDQAPPRIGESRLIGGPGRKVTEEMNRSLGGIGVLRDRDGEEPTLDVYHNPFATLRLPFEALRASGVEQFVKHHDPRELTLWGRLT